MNRSSRSRGVAPILLPVLALLLPAAGLAAAPPPPEPGAPAAAEAPRSAPPVRRWVLLIQGNRAGELTVAESPATASTSAAETWHMAFNDRGRGPDLTTRLTLAADGTPAEEETTGNDYLKAPVEESFSRHGAAATWKNPNEAGTTSVEGAAYYLGSYSAAPDVGLLARALAAAPGNRLPLLPEGEARLERLGTLEVSAGGERRTLTHASITGLGFTPTSVWMAPDGSFFATADSWFSIVPESWEGIVDRLVSAQNEADARRSAELAARLARHPSGPVAITGAALFDPESRRVLAGRTVIVSGEKIAAVGPDGEVEIPAGATRIDATGKTLLPGLWDMHTHLSEVDGILHLAAGVTTVRDLANDVERVTGLRKAWDEGSAIGPRTILAGILDGPGPYAGPTKALVSTEAEAHAWIARYASLGYEQIKLYSSLDPALVPAIEKDAHARGLRLSGHIPNGLTAEQAVQLGFDEIQHINFILLNFWGDQGIDTRTPARFTEVAARAATLDLSSEPVRRFVHLLAERKIVVDPTVAVFEAMFTARPGEVSPPFAAVVGRLPAQVRRGAYGGGLPPPEGMDETYRRSFRKMLDMVGELYRAGVPLVAGTDGLAGFTLHRELELYVEAGIPAPEVLRIATLDAARVMHRDDRLGTVEPGKLADLILVAGNPAEHISDVRNTELVMRGGTLYDPAELYAAIGVRPQPPM